MKPILRNSIYLGKSTYRDFGFSFWILFYPLILVSFFHIAFMGIANKEYKNINIGIERDNPIIGILEEIDMVDLVETPREEVEPSLIGKKIDGFIRKDLDIELVESGINQSIIKSIVEQIKQMSALNLPMENFDFTVNYIEAKTEKANGILVIFYSLIAMVSTYGLFTGIETVALAQANLTNVGARLNTTPFKKVNFLLSGIIVALGLNLVSNGILLLFMKYILGMDLFTELKYSLLFIVLGNFFGISLGVFIGASNKSNVGVKTMMAIMATLFLSFLSGLMSPDVKIMLDKSFPILGRINPIAIISNSLYRVNLLESTRNIGSGILLLILYSLVLILGSYLFLRGRNYDSI